MGTRKKPKRGTREPSCPQAGEGRRIGPEGLSSFSKPAVPRVSDETMVRILRAMVGLPPSWLAGYCGQKLPASITDLIRQVDRPILQAMLIEVSQELDGRGSEGS